VQILDLSISGLKLIEPKIFRDARGFFLQTHDMKGYAAHGVASFVQDNTSFSKKGTVRGLHYQRHPGQDKLVWCLEGEIFDVAVDLRKDSATFGKWMSVILSGKTLQQLYIPKGFAHGFAVLSDEALVQYKVSAPYQAEEEKTILWNDEDIGIDWPIEFPILSDRDKMAPKLKEVIL
jgi:dTDP-4-dehydrorhamnose 3,5-epimerase